MPTLAFYDAVTPSNIPIPEHANVAGYVDGGFAWQPSDWDRFGGRKLRIATRPTTRAHILDVERGNARPEDVPGWLELDQANIGVYCNRSTWPKVIAAIAAAQARRPLYWIAWPGATAIPDSDPEFGVYEPAAAVQLSYAGSYDVSLFDQAAWFPEPQPAPAPTGLTLQQRYTYAANLCLRQPRRVEH